MYKFIRVTPGIPPNNLLMNLYFDNSTIGLHILFVLNMYANFHTYRILFII